MRTRLLTIVILITIAMATSGCWLIFPGQSIGRPTTAPPATEPPATAPFTPPSQAATNAECWRVEFHFAPQPGQIVTPDLKMQETAIVDSRLSSLGTTATAQLARPDGFVVVAPVAIDEQRIRDLVGRTGRLDFVAVPPAYANQVAQGAPLPTGIDPTPMFSGDQISATRPGTDQQGVPAVDVVLKPDGARIFDDFAAKNFNGASGGVKFAIVLDGTVQSALGLNTDHFGGIAQIVGQFSADEVNDLATVLTFGPLPMDLEDQGVTQVSCSTGA